MPSNEASCRRCGAAVDRPSRTCPACGYAVAGHDRARWLFGSLGTLLTCTVVFAPVGLWLLWLADGHRRAAAGTVVEPETTPVVDHLWFVARSWLDSESVARDGGAVGPDHEAVAAMGTTSNDAGGGHTWR